MHQIRGTYVKIVFSVLHYENKNHYEYVWK